MKPLYLIACSASKLDRAAAAADIYTGQAFKLAMKAARRADAEVIILSALHGAIMPDQIIEPYNSFLGGMNKADRAAWAARTAAQLAPYADREAVILAGKHYAAAAAAFKNKTAPLAGLGIGQQLAKLKTL